MGRAGKKKRAKIVSEFLGPEAAVATPEKPKQPKMKRAERDAKKLREAILEGKYKFVTLVEEGTSCLVVGVQGDRVDVKPIVCVNEQSELFEFGTQRNVSVYDLKKATPKRERQIENVMKKQQAVQDENDKKERERSQKEKWRKNREEAAQAEAAIAAEKATARKIQEALDKEKMAKSRRIVGPAPERISHILCGDRTINEAHWGKERSNMRR